MSDEKLSKFIKEKLAEGYTPKEVKEFLTKQNWDSTLIDTVIKANTQKPIAQKSIKYKILFLVIIPLIITLICTPFLTGYYQPELLYVKTEQKIATDVEEECFTILSELIEEYFDLPLDITYEEFLTKSSLNPNYRNFFNVVSEERKIQSYWKSYTFGNQTSLKVLGIPDLVKNHLIHLDYDLDSKFVGCVASQLTLAGKYRFMELDSSKVGEYKNIDYSQKITETDSRSFDTRFYKTLYSGKDGEAMFYSFVITLLPEEAKTVYKEEITSTTSQKFWLKEQANKLIFISLLFLIFVTIMYALNKLYFKLF